MANPAAQPAPATTSPFEGPTVISEGISAVDRDPEPPPLRPALPLALEIRNGSGGVDSRVSPWLGPVAMVATQDLALPLWFRSIRVEGRQWLPQCGPVLLAPTHKARWDALLVPHAAGRRVTGRDCRFMVTIDEMKGMQGWLLRRLGCFAVNQARPSLASLRHAIELLELGEQLVVFPEGRIRREDDQPLRLQQGLARLAALAAGRGVSVPVLPVGIAYSHPSPRPCDRAALCIGEPMRIAAEGRDGAQAFTRQLAEAMAGLEQRAMACLVESPAKQSP
ncbi:MAG: 1-acyl-sn-glycerol-3-phosphate acyltransferase [Cyanobium sp. M30B3]|nr:MAG: 1-acyl-sn-glycerol-3-phosphate acyltransferase [Cyanobium sp. M30B3]